MFFDEIFAIFVPCIIFASVVILHVIMERRGSLHWNNVRVEHLWQGPEKWPSWGLAIPRLLAAALIWYVSWVNFMYYGDGELSVFTTWNWLLMGFYFSATGILSMARPQSTVTAAYTVVSSIFARALWVVFEVLLSTSVLITSCMWIWIIPQFCYHGQRSTFCSSTGYFSFPIVMMNTMNFVLMMCEGTLNRLRFEQWHQIFLVYWLLIYLSFSWIYYYTTNKNMYMFIDFHDPYALSTEMMALLFALVGFQVGAVWTKWMKADTSVSKLDSVTTAQTAEDSRLYLPSNAQYRGTESAA